MNLAANIWKLYLVKISKWFMVHMPVVVLFFQSNGLGLRNVMLVNAIYSITVAGFEIPSGYFSDRLGRKQSILLGTILITLQYGCFSFAHSFGFLAMGAMIGGVGASFISGTDSAMLYDSLYALNRSGDYLKWEGRTYAIGTGSEALAAIIGGWLAYYYSLRMPVYVQVGISSVGILAALTLVEPPKHKSSSRGNWEQVRYILKYTFLENRQLRFFLALTALFGLASLLLAWFAQPYFDYKQIAADKIGYLWAALNLTVAFFALNAHRVAHWSTKFRAFLILFGFGIGYLCLWGFGAWSLVAGLSAMFVMYALRGLATPTFLNLINQHTPSDMRATVLSMRGFCVRILYACLAPLLGWVADVYTILEAFLYMGIAISLSTILAYVLYQKNIPSSA